MIRHSLYYSRYCYFCQKVLGFLQGAQHSIEMLNTAEGTHRQELVQGGGKGQVPCLRIETEQGEVSWMYESDDIIRYIQSEKLLT